MSLNKNWRILGDLVHKAIRNLEKKSIAHAEAFFTATQTTEVVIRNSEILTQNRAEDSGVGFRVATNRKKIGFACTNALNEKLIQESADKALAIAEVGSKTPNFTLPKAGKIPKVKGLFDSKAAGMTVEETVDIAQRATVAAEGFDKRVIVKGGRVIFEIGKRGIVNTSGVDAEEQETRAVTYLVGSGKQPGEVTGSCFNAVFTRTADKEPEEVGENVAKMVIEMFNPKPLRASDRTVVFGPEAVSEQIIIVLIDALKGENVMSRQSVWTRKIGETVASDNLTIADNPLLENGFSSRSFDDEGCPSQNTVLIRNGRLENFLLDATTSNALKMKNTGNASRSPGGFDMVRSIIGNGYRTKPEVYPSNLTIKQGNKTKEKLVAEMEKGVLVESMAGFPQAGSGLISASLSRAFFIENGEKQYAIKGGMISGIAFDWFKNISEVGKDAKQFQNAVVPSLRVDKVKILGA
jgi:PmbA protein